MNSKPFQGMSRPGGKRTTFFLPGKGLRRMAETAWPVKINPTAKISILRISIREICSIFAKSLNYQVRALEIFTMESRSRKKNSSSEQRISRKNAELLLHRHGVRSSISCSIFILFPMLDLISGGDGTFLAICCRESPENTAVQQ